MTCMGMWLNGAAIFYGNQPSGLRGISSTFQFDEDDREKLLEHMQEFLNQPVSSKFSALQKSQWWGSSQKSYRTCERQTKNHSRWFVHIGCRTVSLCGSQATSPRLLTQGARFPHHLRTITSSPLNCFNPTHCKIAIRPRLFKCFIRLPER
jgi:hypothetical protein